MSDYTIRVQKPHGRYEFHSHAGNDRHYAVEYARDKTKSTGIDHIAVYVGRHGKSGEVTHCCGGNGCKPPQKDFDPCKF